MLGIHFNKNVLPNHEDIYIFFAPNRSDLILLEWTGDRVVLPRMVEIATRELSYIGLFENRAVWSGYAEEGSDNTAGVTYSEEEGEFDAFSVGHRFFVKLRESFALIGEGLFMAVCRASMIAYWKKRSRFCGGCGSALQEHGSDLAMHCIRCGEYYYPQITPAVIVAIRRGQQILMVKSKRSLSSFYGLVAGYVEAGETLEEAVHREVKEETNLAIKNLRYVKNQPWPFPSSQMLAFEAEYKSGTLCIQKEELIDAQWFTANEIPPMPPAFSIGGQMVTAFIQEMGVDSNL